MAVQRGLLLLLGLLLASVASWARADDAPSRQSTGQPGNRDTAVRPAWFVAQHPNPDEPLGFSGGLPEPPTPSGPSEQPPVLENDPSQVRQDSPQEFYQPMDLDAPAPAVSSGDWLHNGRWYVQQSVVYMSRSVNIKNELVLANDFSSAALTRQQNTLQVADNGFQPGMRSTIGKFLGRDDRNRDHAVEFTFLGLTHWRSSGGLAAVNPGGIFTLLDFANNVPAFSGSNTQSFQETSSFDSFELNYRVSRRLSHDQMVYTRDSTWVRQCTPTALPSVFAGVRVVTINEKFNYFAQAIGPLINGSYRVSTHNRLVGPQIGTDWFYERSEWRAGIRGKAGAFVNWANQATQVQISDANGAAVQSMQNRTQYAGTDIMSFVAEINLIGLYQFTPCFALRTSYDLMWVTDLALAQNQVSFTVTNPAFVSAQHSLFYQGLSLGFEYTY